MGLEARRLGIALAGEADLHGDVEEDRQVGPQAAGGEVADGQELLHAEAAPEPLVGEGRVEVAIGEDDQPALEGGTDHGLHELGPGGHEEERVGPLGQVDGRLVAIHEDGPDPLPRRRPARLAYQERLAPGGGHGGPEPLAVGGLAASVGSLERDEGGAGAAPVERHGARVAGLGRRRERPAPVRWPHARDHRPGARHRRAARGVVRRRPRRPPPRGVDRRQRAAGWPES